MANPLYAVADYLAGMLALMPRGRVWPRDPDAEIPQTLAGLAPTAASLDARAINLVVNEFIAQSTELLPDWEQSLGLPDPCAGISPTIELRRAQVVARFVGDGGQSIAYYVKFAATLGYAISIQEYVPFRFGQNFGMPLNGDAWAYAWQVNGPTYSIERFTFGTSEFGEPFAYWSNDVLQCELQRIAPAHTKVLFNYD